MGRMNDGYQTTVNVNGNELTVRGSYEKDVKTPGMKSGGMMDLTGMRNVSYRTGAPKTLITISGMELDVFIDPNSWLLAGMLGYLGLNTTIVITFPRDTAGVRHTLTVWGFIDEWEPNPFKEGEPPTAKMKIEVTNLNNSNPQVEVGPVYT